LRGLEDKRAQVFPYNHGAFGFLHRTERNKAILILHKFFCSFGVELLVLDDPILRHSHILVVFLIMQDLLFLGTKLSTLALDILIFYLYHIFLVLVDDAQQLTLDLYEML
jgi:hypothetical protein